ncbi:hypothetical protein LTR10_014523 [Elasticomyces elasticus]|uniref:Glycosyltransferase family 71 protein n=1 Tax=Exophiala sideris TaxID=1016849 RepID=A0ABR0JT57_9EURO|nr:hypothetical protein LTR10_014523 [Elasticomyces elasticus]KAK5040502.1 hypothetical protein LTS07_001000 [Exophiala sideris]KAK5043072.1 hypothetical protein LTR13_000843 [Exophiala sideris]KAK5068880.1 hypothetical protein LTR69_001001 [Exophiala sideris]KAK5186476.1 hypothetical protein LTR44_001532 [Eurotiomycetes sp. CCFEE 6388]
MLLNVKTTIGKSILFVFGIVCILQFFIVFYRDTTIEEQESVQTAALLHESVDAYSSPNDSEHPFGLKGRKVAALADLAQHYSDNPSLSYSKLNDAINREFPWWDSERLSYIPWRTNATAWPKHRPETTGIVICAGDSMVFEAAHLISSLRNVIKSKLPIEIAYGGDEDLSPASRAFLTRTVSTVGFVDLNQIFDNNLVYFRGWSMKPLAILASRFSRTILVDADAVFYSAPEKIFDSYPGHRETGTLFFHDRYTDFRAWAPRANERRPWIGAELATAQRPPSGYLNTTSLFWSDYTVEEQDSAVVVIDKARPKLYLAALFAAWMNTPQVRDWTYELFYGDKESYWLACELSGMPYTFEPWYAAIMAEQDYLLLGGKMCTRHMTHAKPDGSEPLWSNRAIFKDKIYPDTGFANWTHWYLGARIDETLAAITMKTENASDTTDQASGSPSNAHTDANELSPHEETRRIVSSMQPNWDGWSTGGKDGCAQYDERRWSALSPRFRRTVEALVAEAEILNIRHATELGSAEEET